MKKKLIQMMVTFALILIAGIVFVGVKIVEHYTPTKEMANLYDYYDVTATGGTVILMQGNQLEERGFFEENICYVPLSVIQEYISPRFYWDNSVRQVVFTTPEDIYKISVGESSYTKNGEFADAGFSILSEKEDTIYMALDFAMQYANFYYEHYSNPERVLIYYQWGEQDYVDVKKASPVRLRGGIKSEILKNTEVGETLFLLEKLEEWSYVRTKEGLRGYIKNDCISNSYTKTLTNPTGYIEPVYTSLQRDFKINLAFHQIGGSCNGSTITSAMNGVTGVNVVAPTWFFLADNNGNLESRASKEYVQAAHNLGLEVWGLVENMTYNVSTYQVVSNMASRENLVKQLIDSALEYHMDGINVDFEALSFDAEEGFMQFIRELSIACRKNGMVLSIDNYVPTASSEHYNRTEQGIVADYVIIMGYDEHYAGMSEAGSTASIGFVEKGIVNTLKEVPAEKVINAIPFYTRVFKQTPVSLATDSDGGVLVEDFTSEFGSYLLSSQAVSMATAKQLLVNNQVAPIWDEALGQYYGDYLSNGCRYMIWLEDKTSIGLKMKLIQDYHLAGVAEWSLNLSDGEIWDVISSYLQ